MRELCAGLWGLFCNTCHFSPQLSSALTLAEGSSIYLFFFLSFLPPFPHLLFHPRFKPPPLFFSFTALYVELEPSAALFCWSTASARTFIPRTPPHRAVLIHSTAPKSPPPPNKASAWLHVCSWVGSRDGQHPWHPHSPHILTLPCPMSLCPPDPMSPMSPMSLCPHVRMASCPHASVLPCHHVPTPPSPQIPMFSCLCVHTSHIPMFTHPHIPTFPHPHMPMSPCPYVLKSPYSCVPVFSCPNIPMSPYFYIPMSPSPHVPVCPLVSHSYLLTSPYPPFPISPILHVPMAPCPHIPMSSCPISHIPCPHVPISLPTFDSSSGCKFPLSF